MRLLAVRPAQRCAICHGALAPDEGRACPSCATRGHDPCLDEVGCPTLGCRARPAAFASSLASWAVPEPPPRRTWWLIEGVVGVGVLCLLVAAVLVNMDASCRGPCRADRIRADLRALSDACDLFKIDTGRYPRQIGELWSAPAGVGRWNGPYLQEWPPLDPWGREYIYLPPRAGASLAFVSLGADGFAGGDEAGADIWPPSFDGR